MPETLVELDTTCQKNTELMQPSVKDSNLLVSFELRLVQQRDTLKDFFGIHVRNLWSLEDTIGGLMKSTVCQLSSGTQFFPYFSRMALISIDCYTDYTLLERYIPTLQNEVLFVLKTSLVFA